MKLDDLVITYYDNLNDTDIEIWNYIVNHKLECTKMSIEELAKLCMVSRMTILRFTKKISLDGYSDLKFLLKEEFRNQKQWSKEEIDNTCEQHVHTIHLLKTMDLRSICQMLFEANRCFVYGTGFLVKSSMQILKEEMFKTNVVFNLLQGNGEMRTYLENIEKDDVMVLFSISGENEQVIEYSKQLKEKGVKLIVFCPFKDSTLGKYADAFLNFSPFMTKENAKSLHMYPISMLIFSIELLYYEYCLYLQEQFVDNV
ncbi:MAG: MurR/RpiR family transcriptional regulator [Longicatena sp.]